MFCNHNCTRAQNKIRGNTEQQNVIAGATNKESQMQADCMLFQPCVCQLNFSTIYINDTIILRLLFIEQKNSNFILMNTLFIHL